MDKNKKKIGVLVILFFFVACSNNIVQNKISEVDLINLEKFNRDIKENIAINNINFLKENSENSIKNNHILKEMEKIDFSNLNIFISKVKFEEKNPSSVLALNSEDNTFYFELIYIYDYHSKKWLIYKVNERRWKFWVKQKIE